MPAAHAAGTGSSPAPADVAADLVRARSVLLAAATPATERTGERRRPGRGPGTARPAAPVQRLGAQALRQALVDLHEFWLATRCAELGIRPGSGLALVAVGGLGRRELMPYSDLDLVLLHRGLAPEQLSELADQLWYPLWDAHVKLDHSVRTVDEALEVAAADLTAALGLLEARHVAGDATLTDALVSRVRQQWRAGIRGRFDELVAQAETRWRRSGDIAHKVEPDLKNGRGGLRDLQLLDALAVAQLTDRTYGLGPDAPGGGLPAAQRRLLDVRTELHRSAGRARDTLRAQDADEIGAALRIGDRFDLARVLTDASRTVGYSVDVGLRTARASLPRRLGSLRRGPVRRPLDEGVVEHGGEVALARDAHPAKDPALVLRVASASVRTGLPVAGATLSRLADTAPELREPWPRDALDELFVLLGGGRRLVATVEALDRTGLWGRLLPEWGTVRDLPPRDAVHTWTVDRHLVETCAYAADLTTRVSRPDLLVLGALLHDIGKGRGGDHSVVGAELVTHIGHRLGLWPSDVALLSAMVRHHLLLPETATRRDLHDPAVIQGVADTLGGDTVLLELLAALAEADSLATGPGVWGDWKASLVRELVTRTRLVTAGEPLPAPEPVTGEQAAAAEAGELRVEVAAARPGHPVTVTVVAPERTGLLSAAAGVLAVASLQVHAASLRSHAGSAVDTFTVSPRFGDPPDGAFLRQELGRALAGTLDLRAALAAKERAYGESTAGEPDESSPVPLPDAPARVLWFDDGSGHPVVELRATDRTGLLFDVAGVLEARGVGVRWAKVATLGTSVVDSFSLDLGAADDRAGREALEDALLDVVAPVPGQAPAPVEPPDVGVPGTTG